MPKVRNPSRHSWIGALLTLVLAAATPARSAVFWVGGDGACDHSSIPAALLDAFLAPGHDTIRIASNASWTAQALAISNQSVTLTGGYATCGSAPTPNATTTLDGAGGSTAAVVTISNSGGSTILVELENLRLTGGENGGLRASGAVLVSATRLFVLSNAATNGGGVYLDGAGGGAIVLDERSSVSSNIATGNGGGIYCTGPGIVGTHARIALNEAGSFGGGIHATMGCTVNAYPDLAPDSGIVDNRATGDGGGIDASFGATINLIGNAADSMTVESNRSLFGRGGGIFAIGTGTAVYLTDTRVGFNRADFQGGGIALAGGATLEIERSPSCPRGIRCSEIVANSHVGSTVPDRYGGGLAIWGGAQAVVSETLLAGNATLAGGAVAWVDGVGSSLEVDGAVITGSVLSGPQGVVEAHNGAIVTFSYSSFLANLDPTQALFLSRSGAAVRLYSSLVADDAGVVFDIASATGDADCLLAHEIGSMPISATRIGPPTPPGALVVGGALADAHLLPTSPAIDFCDDGVVGAMNPDIDGEARGIDRPEVPNLHGPFDLGADEFSDSGPVVFVDGFESGGSSEWSLVVP